MEPVEAPIGQASRLRAWHSFPASHWRALAGTGWHWMTLSGYWQALAGSWQAFSRHSAGIGGQRCCLGVRAALDSSKDKIDERTVLPGLRRCRMTPLVFQGVVCRGSVLRTGVPKMYPLYPRATPVPLTAGHRQQLAAVIRPGSSTRIAPVPIQRYRRVSMSRLGTIITSPKAAELKLVSNLGTRCFH